MQITSHNKILHMDSRFFKVDGIDFEIIATGINSDNVCHCAVKNLSNGNTKDIEHQTLCHMILKKQREIIVKAKSRNKKYMQIGIGV